MTKAHGTQSIERALRLLRELSSRPRPGWRLTDLAERCDLDRGTASRILSCLVRERFAVKRAADHHFVPGPALYELGLAHSELAAFEVQCRPALARLASRTRCVAFLFLRSGADFVCAARTGEATIKGLSIQVGTRRPLCVSAGGMAILIAMPPGERAAVLVENRRRLRASRDTRLASVDRMLRRSMEREAGVNLGDFVPHIHALGLALRDAGGAPMGALVVSGPSDLLPSESIDETLALMRAEARAVEAPQH